MHGLRGVLHPAQTTLTAHLDATRWRARMHPRSFPSLLHGAGIVLLAVHLGGCGCSENRVVGNGPTQIEDPDNGHEPLADDWGAWLSMAVNPDGAPVVSYYNRTQGALGVATARWTEDNELRWDHEQVDGYADESGFDSADRGAYTALAVAADGTHWVVYQDVQNEALRYATRGAGDTEWTTGLADTQSEAGFYASLALDGSGSPIAAHYAQGDGELRVTRWNGTAFTGDVVDEGLAADADTGTAPQGDVGKYASIAVADSIEYIAYYDAANGDLKLAWGTAGNHNIEVVDDAGDVGAWPDVMVVGDTLYISYHDQTNGDLKLAVGAPGSFAVEVVDDGDHVGADSHLWQAGDAVQIAYFDGFHNDMKQAYRSGDAWQARTVTDSPGALGFHNEVVVTSGQTWGACYDYTNRTLWFQSLD